MSTAARWPLRQSAHARAFDFVSGLVRSALARSRRAYELVLPDSPNFKADPADGVLWVRLTPVPGKRTPFASVGYGAVSYLHPLDITVEMRSGDNLYANAANVADLIRAALEPDGTQPADAIAFRRRAGEAGISELYYALPAEPADKDEKAEGRIEVVCYT